jgi:hypothetical protein
MIYKVELNEKMMEIVDIPRMLQRLAFIVCQAEQARPFFLCH